MLCSIHYSLNLLYLMLTLPITYLTFLGQQRPVTSTTHEVLAPSPLAVFLHSYIESLEYRYTFSPANPEPAILLS